MSNNAGGSRAVHPFTLDSPILGDGGNFYSTALTLNSNLDKYAISFITNEDGYLDYLKMLISTSSLSASSIVFSVFEDSGGIPSGVQVGSDIAIASYSGTLPEDMRNIDLSPGIGPLTKGTRYWLVVKLSGWAAGSMAIGVWVGHIRSFSNNALDFYVAKSDEGAAWAAALVGFPLMTMRVGSSEFGFPFRSMASIGSPSHIGSATLDNDYFFISGFPFPILVRGVAGGVRRNGTPTATPFFRLLLGGKNYDTAPIPAVPSFVAVNQQTRAGSFFGTPVVIPSNTPFGVGLGCAGESSGNYWSMFGLATTFEGKFGGFEWWKGWRNKNGVITPNRMPSVGFYLDPTNPIPLELNRRQFFNAR